MKYVFEQHVPDIETSHYDSTDFRSEDGGMAKILTTDSQGNLFVRLQSWDEEKIHPELKSMVGKKVRITVEVVE